MTLRVRRNTITALILLQASILVGLIIGLTMIDKSYTELSRIYSGLTARLVWLAVMIPIQVLLLRLFRKSSIPEMFLTLFSTCLIGLESISTVFIFFHELQQALLYYELVARLFLLLQISGITGFFFISMYAGGIQYSKIANILWTQLIVGLLFAYALPIQTAGSFTIFSIPAGSSFYPILYGGAFLAILAGGSGFIQQRSLEGWRLLAACFLMITGRMLSFAGTSGMYTAGMIVFLAGLAVFSTEQYQRYLWN
ncbi:hypothetical protein [Spirochaeta dissipatitropha]